MDEGTAAGPKRNWWSRSGQRPPEPAAQAPAAAETAALETEQTAITREFAAPPAEAAGAAPAGQEAAAPPRQQPLHPQDPYGTPPYGDPGPWAPAPPVQRPTATPAHGTSAPAHGTSAPAHGTATPAHGTATPAHGTGIPPQSTGATGAMGAAPQSPVPPPPGQQSAYAGQQSAYGTGAPVPPPQQPFPAQPQPPAGPQPHEVTARTPMPQPEPPSAHAQPPHAPSAPDHRTATTPPSGTDTALPAAADGARLPAVSHDASGGAPLPPEAHGAPPPGLPHHQPQPHVPQPLPGGAEPYPAGAAGHQQGGQQGHWQQYDPWRTPQHGAAMPLGTLPPPPPPGPRRNRRGTLAAGAVALALLAGGIGGGVGAYIERNGGLGGIELPQDTGDQGGRKPDSVAGIAQAALPSVVTLHVRGNSEQGTGTGFVLDKQGHILTNNHVVEPAGTGGEISVSFSGGQTAKAKVIGRDGSYDLAVVQVQGVSGLRPLALGDSDSVRVGDPVVAIGAPYDLANTVTAGIISAKQRPITAGGKKGDGSDVSYVDALQTDAPINPGNSGGPLVDSRARVIGINSAIRAADSSGGGLEGGGQGGSIGLGFAIPINQGKWVAEQLINKGKVLHPVIGVTLEMEYAGDGARVSSKSKDGGAPVTPGGPGAKAGVKPRDVITKVDGQPVHSGQELIIKIRSHRPGDRLTLTLRRDDKELTTPLTLGAE
ncbi:hypothetical protein A6A06_03025 [Streptomyces sp. CB02923]|uniref:trypsin-like peptidase domain-containing protein n=1 Tax=Streptomyces sp. CB02923 TaxID=1718985 RepID=UPI00093CD9EE|nr:trypsin-like peptidase domain-containing protein [Streptomyces sp. CB02923]OKI09654.1 hypothetical protein A6A06_03025 [Streptomyces sp. CB02923]